MLHLVLICTPHSCHLYCCWQGGCPKIVHINFLSRTLKLDMNTFHLMGDNLQGYDLQQITLTHTAKTCQAILKPLTIT